MARYRFMGHTCPTCDDDVYGLLSTKIYCDKKCRSKFNKLKELQLEELCEGFSEYQKKNFEVLHFTMGDSKNFFIASLHRLQKKNFRPQEYCVTSYYRGIKVYVVGAYCYFIKKDLVYVFRTGKVEELFKGIEARWKLDFPELSKENDLEGKLMIKEAIENFDNAKMVVLRDGYWERAVKSWHRKLGVWRI